MKTKKMTETRAARIAFSAARTLFYQELARPKPRRKELDTWTNIMSHAARDLARLGALDEIGRAGLGRVRRDREDCVSRLGRSARGGE